MKALRWANESSIKYFNKRFSIGYKMHASFYVFLQAYSAIYNGNE